MRVLTLNESLEEKVAVLRELSGLPIFVGTGKGLGEPLSKFLDISNVEAVVLCIPWMPRDRIYKADGKIDTQAECEDLHRREKVYRDWFQSVGLHCGISPHVVVSVEGVEVPEDLGLYVFNQRRSHFSRDTTTYRALRFYVSDIIANPIKTVRREAFHKATRENVQKYGLTTYRQIVAPGHHLPNDSVTAESWNRYLVADKDPGDCIVCAGASGERKHFGHITWGPGPYATGLICRACARASFDQILALLD